MSEKKMKRTGRSKDQVAFQFPPDIAAVVAQLERKTGASRGRIGIAAIIALLLQGERGFDYCLQAATGLDFKELTLDQVLAELRVWMPPVMGPCGKLAEYMRREDFPPDGKISQAMLKTALEEYAKNPSLKEAADRETYNWYNEEVEFAQRRWEEADARLKKTQLQAEGGGQAKSGVSVAKTAKK